MKTFQTMDCVFNEIILCNWVWHWDVKAMQKFRDFFPTPFAKQRFWFPHRNPNWDLEPTHNSPPLLCCPVLSWWAEDSTGKWPNMAWNSEPWTRGRIMEIQSVWNWKQVEPPGKVRISNEQPGVVNSLKLFSPIMSERERKNIPGKSISGNPGNGWKKTWISHRVLWKPPAEIQLHPVSGPHNLECVPPPLFTYIPTHPNCCATYSTDGIYIKSHQMYSSLVPTQPGLKPAREIGPPTGL